MTDDTKQRILDAAEQLFGEHGFDGVSVRQITRAADANVAAVHYHFGSKESVLRGITDRVAGPINARRRELLDATVAGAAPATPDIEVLLDAFMRPDVEMLLQLQDRGPVVARFLGRTYADQTPWIQEMAQEQFAEASDFFPAIAVALPHLTPAEIAWRISRVVAVIVHIFSTWPEDGMSEADAEVLLGRLVTFLSAGLRAPLPDLAPISDPRR